MENQALVLISSLSVRADFNAAAILKVDPQNKIKGIHAKQICICSSTFVPSFANIQTRFKYKI